jgi:hypothetical protein
MKLRTLALSVLLLSVPASVLAQSGGGSPEMHAARDAALKACQPEVSGICGGKEGRDLMMCLRSSTDKESPECKDAVSKLPERHPQPAS